MGTAQLNELGARLSVVEHKTSTGSRRKNMKEHVGASWVPPGSPLFFDGSWVVSPGERPGFDFFPFLFVLEIGGQNDYKMLSKMVPDWMSNRRE